MKRIVCFLLGHSLPAIAHPWWHDCYHATCFRCGQKCLGFYDPQYGDVEWVAEQDHKPGWFNLPPFPKWRGWK